MPMKWPPLGRTEIYGCHSTLIGGHSRNHRRWPVPYRATLPVRSKRGAVHRYIVGTVGIRPDGICGKTEEEDLGLKAPSRLEQTDDEYSKQTEDREHRVR